MYLFPHGFNYINSQLYPDSLKCREKFLAFGGLVDSDAEMIRGGFLSAEDRDRLIALARDGSTSGVGLFRTTCPCCKARVEA